MLSPFIDTAISSLKKFGQAELTVRNIPYAYASIRQKLYEELRIHGFKGKSRVRTTENGNLLVTLINRPLNKVSSPSPEESRPTHQLITDKCSLDLLKAYKLLLSDEALYGVEILGKTEEQLRLMYPDVLDELGFVINGTPEGVVLV